VREEVGRKNPISGCREMVYAETRIFFDKILACLKAKFYISNLIKVQVFINNPVNGKAFTNTLKIKVI